jgi:membrane-associated HD superfamily phosphohydrolase
VRSLKEPTPAHIRAMVTRLIDQRAQDGQLDESGITLADIAVIKDKLVAVMTTVYHKRVAYPGPERDHEQQTAPDDAIVNDEGAAESG